ncbi:MAG: hypothetical protein ACREXR_13900 [Gammaproteobacteria bacterium]
MSTIHLSSNAKMRLFGISVLPRGIAVRWVTFRAYNLSTSIFYRPPLPIGVVLDETVYFFGFLNSICLFLPHVIDTRVRSIRFIVTTGAGGEGNKR